MVSDKGNIKSYLTDECGKILSKRYDKDGYEMVWTKYNSASRVHKLVLMTFNPEGYFKGAVVNHINGVKDDNRLENLEWCTVAQNTKHAYEMGLAKSSKCQCVGVFYNNEVLSVFESFNSLSRHCSVDRNTLSNNCKNGIPIFDELYLKKLDMNEYFHLLNKPFYKNHMSRYQLQPVEYKNIYYESIKELAEELNVDHSIVSKAVCSKKLINGSFVHKITRYEFIKQENFND